MTYGEQISSPLAQSEDATGGPTQYFNQTSMFAHGPQDYHERTEGPRTSLGQDGPAYGIASFIHLSEEITSVTHAPPHRPVRA